MSSHRSTSARIAPGAIAPSTRNDTEGRPPESGSEDAGLEDQAVRAGLRICAQGLLGGLRLPLLSVAPTLPWGPGPDPGAARPSVSTVERNLRKIRRVVVGRRVSQTKPGGLLRREVPVVVGKWRSRTRPLPGDRPGLTLLGG